MAREGARRSIAIADPLHDRLAHASGGQEAGTEEEVRALMPGRVVEVRVSVGEEIAGGSLLLVLEAMKMQNEILCQRGGLVTVVEVAAGQTVETGTVLVRVAPSSASRSD